MSSVEGSIIDSLCRSAAIGECVWFLKGPTHPGEPVRHIPIDGQEYLVGRKSGCALVLQHRTVSGSHAKLEFKDGDLFLTDLGSTNGTYLNGNRVDKDETVAVGEEDLIHFAEAPFRVLRQSPTGMTNGTFAENVCDQALALVQFDRLMSERLVKPHYQSIVKLSNIETIGYEILGRGSVFGLESVGAMFKAAAQLNLEVELSQLLRWEGIRVGRELPDRPALFVNTHPRELEDNATLIDSLQKVHSLAGNTQLVLEIHEASVTNPKQLQGLQLALKDLNIQLAYDDFGSGQARLAELIEARPDFVKFDISLIRNLDSADAHRRRMLETLVQMVRDLDIRSLAEGIETAEEAAACRETGFDLAQGYFYGRPAPANLDG